jgi:23S rRNA pseudouridine1911/1915/1917 synthase
VTDHAVSAPMRLDLWLAADRNISRSAAQALVAAGAVQVNGRPARAGQRIAERDSVIVTAPAAPAALPRAADAPDPLVALHVVYEDDMLAVIDKPAGLVVHPAPGHPHGTLADGLRQRGDVWSFLGGAERPGIVHRLDRSTSGLLVVAKTEAAHRSLSAQLAARTLGRTYWAMVWGGFTETTGEIDKPIGRDPRHRQRMAVVDRGRPAQTDFRVVERLGAVSVLDVTLRTGRTHQIRVHLASIGHPIVGDPVYGRRHDERAGRPALHARRLRLTHPGDGTERVFESPLPADLVELLEQARRGELR